ncbi:hypothetical protein BH11PLA1_BH11PLA1_13380 [soil metagenome]
MASEKSPLLRLVVPLAILSVCGVIAFTAFGPKAAPPIPPATTPAPSATGGPGTASAPVNPPLAPGATRADAPGATPALEATGAKPAAANGAPTPPAIPGLHAETSSGPITLPVLGGLDPDAAKNPFVQQLVFTPGGAGLEALELSRQFDSIGANRKHEVLQRRESYDVMTLAGTTTRQVVPLAAIGAFVNGQFVALDGANVWKVSRRATAAEDAAVFVARIVDGAGAPVAEITRTFRLRPEHYDIELLQEVKNLGAAAITVKWVQYGPADLPIGVIRYGGDSRRLRFGHLADVRLNPDLQYVSGERFAMYHSEMLGSPKDDMGSAWDEKQLWPNDAANTEGLRLAWIGTTNRYFTVTAHALSDTARLLPSGLPDKSFANVGMIDRVVLGRGGTSKSTAQAAAVSALRFVSPELTLAPGAAADLSMGIYAGPMSKSVIKDDDRLVALNMQEMAIYSFGGPCAFCTFQWLARLLRAFLGFLHDYIVYDWSLAIVVLVVCVRTVLHPVTKWSQTSIQRFGKQMQAVAPKQKKLQEKYASDPQKLREEVAKLMKEEEVNYAGMLGCLPMFLQTPIWIALSAMIYFTFELRHTPALFGVFQKISPGWTFWADLAEPDKLIPFAQPLHIPLLSGLMGPIDGINLLPILMGVLFFAQQKYLTPPPTVEATPEQQTQQKIMKFMIVFLFPLFMYNAPSALVTYFLANSGLGIIEGAMIRKQIKRLDEAAEERKRLVREGKSPPPPPKQPGFFARMQQMALDKQAQIQRNQGGQRGGPGKPKR